MKLIVMGAGYVGKALLTSLQKLPHQLVITTTQKERIEELKEYGQSVFLLDPFNSQSFHELIETSDGICILVAPKNGQNYEDTYLNTAEKISSALKGRQKPFYLLYTGSTSVCEGIQTDWVTEKRALYPLSENAKILLETESEYQKCEADVCILRLGGIYGPKRELTERAKRFSGKEMAGTGEEATNHIHLEDIVKAIIFCLEHSLAGIYHLVNDTHTTRKHLYDTLCQSLDLPGPTWNPGLEEQRKGGYRISNQKIKDAGFTFTHPNILLQKNRKFAAENSAKTC